LTSVKNLKSIDDHDQVKSICMITMPRFLKVALFTLLVKIYRVVQKNCTKLMTP